FAIVRLHLSFFPFFFFFLLPPPPRSTLFPYTTLFRSRRTYADLFLKVSKDSSINNSSLYFYDLNLKGNYQFNDRNIVYLSGYFGDRKSTRLNSSHVKISYAVFCLKKKIHYTHKNSILT